MAFGEYKVKETACELESRAAAETKKSALNRLTALKLYVLFQGSGEESSVELIATALGVTPQTVDGWLSTYSRHGLEGLLSERASGTRTRRTESSKQTRKSKRNAGGPETGHKQSDATSEETSAEDAAALSGLEVPTAGAGESPARHPVRMRPKHGRAAPSRGPLEHRLEADEPPHRREQHSQDFGDSFASQLGDTSRRLESDSPRDGEDTGAATGTTAASSTTPSAPPRGASRRKAGVRRLARRARVRLRASRRSVARASRRRADADAGVGDVDEPSQSAGDPIQAAEPKAHAADAPQTRPPDSVVPESGASVPEARVPKAPVDAMVSGQDAVSYDDKVTQEAGSTQASGGIVSASSLPDRPRPAYRPDRGASVPEGHAFLRAGVLIAEPDDLITDIIKHRLEKQGATVTCAKDGIEVVSRFWSTRFDLVIIAAALPGLDGFEIARWLREHQSNSQVPILITSWPGNESDLVRAFDAGADDFLTKPFSPAELVARSRRLLERVSGWKPRQVGGDSPGAGASDA